MHHLNDAGDSEKAGALFHICVPWFVVMQTECAWGTKERFCRPWRDCTHLDHGSPSARRRAIFRTPTKLLSTSAACVKNFGKHFSRPSRTPSWIQPKPHPRWSPPA